jgi:hypothetical protein
MAQHAHDPSKMGRFPVAYRSPRTAASRGVFLCDEVPLLAACSPSRGGSALLPPSSPPCRSSLSALRPRRPYCTSLVTQPQLPTTKPRRL